MGQTVHLGARVPVELFEAAAKAAGLPPERNTAVIRYALAKLAGLDPHPYTADRPKGRHRKAAAA